MDSVAVLPHVVRRAERLISSSESARACRLLAHALAEIDPVTARPDPRLINAAIVYAATLSFKPDNTSHADTQLTWARYAETAARTCHGLSSSLWHQAANCYADVCAVQGLTFDAVALHNRKVAAYRTYGPSDRVTSARDRLATALHSDSQCVEARTEIDEMLRCWKRTRSPDQRTGRQLLTTYTGILAGCGHTGQAHLLLREHADVIATEYAPQRESDTLVMAVQIAMTERDHPPVCTIHRAPTPARTPAASTAPPADRWRYWHTALHNLHPNPAAHRLAGTDTGVSRGPAQWLP